MARALWAGWSPQQQSRGAAAGRRSIRRCGNATQGRALEMLGHAVEYLLDSRLTESLGESAAADAEAVQLLKRASRAVFDECPEVLPAGYRLRRWFTGRS